MIRTWPGLTWRLNLCFTAMSASISQAYIKLYKFDLCQRSYMLLLVTCIISINGVRTDKLWRFLCFSPVISTLNWTWTECVLGLIASVFVMHVLFLL